MRVSWFRFFPISQTELRLSDIRTLESQEELSSLKEVASPHISPTWFTRWLLVIHNIMVNINSIKYSTDYSQKYSTRVKNITL